MALLLTAEVQVRLGNIAKGVELYAAAIDQVSEFDQHVWGLVFGVEYWQAAFEVVRLGAGDPQYADVVTAAKGANLMELARGVLKNYNVSY